jgi:NitT/TauT family transport system permease protein
MRQSGLGHSLRGVILPLSLLVVWEIAARFGVFSRVVLPPPSAVFVRLIAGMTPAQEAPGTDTLSRAYLSWLLSGELVQDSIATLSRVLAGFAVGAALALPLGLVMGASERVHQLCNPLVQILRPIPPIAYIPLAIVWFGLGNPPAIFLIALGAFFPVLMNTIAGVRNIDGVYVRAALNLGAGPVTLFLRIMLPAATPYILTGIRVGMGSAFICVIVAEMIAVSDGLGFRILEAREYMWSDKIIAGMMTIGLIGLAIDMGVSRLNDYLLRWRRGLDR